MTHNPKMPVSPPGRALILLVAMFASASVFAAPPTAPTIRWPTRLSDGRVFADNVAVVESEHDTHDANPHSILLTYAAERIEAWDPASMRARWTTPVACPFQPRNILSTSRLLVFATPYEIFAVDRETGDTPWRLPITAGTNSADDLVDADRWTDFFASDQVIAAVDNRGRVVCADAGNGERLWQMQLDDTSAQWIGCDRLAVFVVSHTGNDPTLSAYALSDGRLLGTAKLPGDYKQGPARVTSVGLAMCVESWMIGFDSQSRALRWRSPIPRPMIRRCFAGVGDNCYWIDETDQLTALDLQDGRARWRVDVSIVGDADWLVASADGAYVIAGKPGLLVCLDATTGRVVWRHSGREYPYAHPPLVSNGDIIVTYRLPNRADTLTTEPSHSYCISRIACSTGMTMPASGAGDIVTQPIAHFAGITAREDAVIVLDGQRLIGYVSTRYRK